MRVRVSHFNYQAMIFCVSAKSACNSKSLEPSHVIKAIEDDEDYLYGAVRFSIGEHNTKAEIDYVINAIKKILLLVNAINFYLYHIRIGGILIENKKLTLLATIGRT